MREKIEHLAKDQFLIYGRVTFADNGQPARRMQVVAMDADLFGYCPDSCNHTL